MSTTEKEEGHVSADSVKHQLLSYEHEIKAYLDKLEATVDTYKFSVEKTAEGLKLDMALVATVHVKPKHK